MTSQATDRGLLHHVEVWGPDLPAATSRWGWLLTQLGYEPFQSWEAGVSYRLGPTYVVLEHSPAMTDDPHERRRPGVNHLAFHDGSRSQLDDLVSGCAEHGWYLMFADRHPFAGGPEHYAAYLQDGDENEVELVAA